MLDLPGDLASPLPANYSEFPNSCLSVQLAFGEQALQVFVDGRNGDLKQLAHECLRQPDCLLLEPALDARPPILRLIQDKAACRLLKLAVAHCVSPAIMVRMRSVTPFNSASISLSGRGGLNT